MSIEIDISHQAGDWAGRADVPSLAKKAVEQCFVHLGMANIESELSILLTNDESIKELNTQWRNKNNATNVLSFPAFEISAGDEPGQLLGDIVLAYDTIEREAKNETIDFADHLTHLIVHGLLHLLGYDHENDTDAEQMEALETLILAKLGVKDPYALPVSDS